MSRLEDLLEELIGEVQELRQEIASIRGIPGQMVDLADIKAEIENLVIAMPDLVNIESEIRTVSTNVYEINQTLENLEATVNSIDEKMPDGNLQVHDIDDIYATLRSIESNTA